VCATERCSARASPKQPPPKGLIGYDSMHNAGKKKKKLIFGGDGGETPLGGQLWIAIKNWVFPAPLLNHASRALMPARN